MTRFNFLAATQPKRPRLREMTIAARLRAPLGALAGTAALVAALYTVQTVRLHVASEWHDNALVRLAQSEAAVRQIKSLDANVARRSALAAAVIEVQRSGTRRANELAWIGNTLPSETWLSSVRVDAGNYALEGGAKRVAAVGAALLALRSNSALGIPRLLSVTDEGTAVPGTVRYVLRLEAPRP